MWYFSSTKQKEEFSNDTNYDPTLENMATSVGTVSIWFQENSSIIGFGQSLDKH